MRTASFTQRMLAVSLAIILVSCSAARHYFAYFLNTRAGKLAAKMRFCEEECAKERNACYERLRRQRQEAVEFSNAERAIEWIKRNKEALAVGAVVVIAAVVFVAVVRGTGGCVPLIPIVLFASSEAPTGHYIAEACQ